MKTQKDKRLLTVDADLVKLCGEREDPDVLVFVDLSLNGTINRAFLVSMQPIGCRTCCALNPCSMSYEVVW